MRNYATAVELYYILNSSSVLLLVVEQEKQLQQYSYFVPVFDTDVSSEIRTNNLS